MSIYAEDNAPEQSLPEFSPLFAEDPIIDTDKCRSLGALPTRGWVPRVTFTATNAEGHKIGIALKIPVECHQNAIETWIAQASEALHRHLDEKEKRAKG